jgi:hypothetical protein
VSFQGACHSAEARRRGGIQASRIAHVYSGEAISPSEGRDLANGLLKAAESAERLDEKAIPILEEYLAAVESLDRDRSPKVGY